MPILWFEGLYRRLRLPFYIGVAIFGALFPTLLSIARVYAETAVVAIDPQSLKLYLGWMSIAVASQVVARHICWRMKKLDTYVQSMTSGEIPTGVGLLCSAS